MQLRDQPYSRDGRRCKAPPVGCFLSGIAPAKSFFAGFFIAEKRSVLYADKHPQADTDRDAQRHCLCSDAGGPVPGGHVPEIRAQRRCYYVGRSALGAYDLGSRIGDRILSGDVLGQRDGHPGLCHEHRVLLFLCLHRSAGVQKAPQPERCAGRAGFGQRGHGGADDAVELPDHSALHGLPPGGGGAAAAPRLPALQPAESRSEYGDHLLPLQAGVRCSAQERPAGAPRPHRRRQKKGETS